MRISKALTLAASSALLLSGCQFNGLYDVPLPGGAAQGGHDYHVTVEFSDVLDLVPQSAVKVNEVTVGAVESVKLDGWHARVRLRLADSVQLPGNAIAEIKQTSLLGEKYVALSAPTDVPPSGRLTDGAVVPLARSGQNPEVEEVLSALSALLNGGGVAQLHTITVELNNAMAGREDRVRDLVSQLDTFVGGLDAQKTEIVRALESIDRLSRTLNDQSGTIKQAVDTIPPALKVLADEREKLTGMLTSLSQLGDVGTRVINASRDDTLADLKQLAPILTQLNQAGTDLPNALELLTTYPFPRNVVDAVKGDYVNLKITADLDFPKLYNNLVTGPPPSNQPSPSPTPSPKPSTPGLPIPLPSLPGLPSVSGVPLPSQLPCVPGVSCQAPNASPSPSSGGGSGGLCLPPLCLGGNRTTHAGYRTPGQQDDSGVDPALAALMTKGMLL